MNYFSLAPSIIPDPLPLMKKHRFLILSCFISILFLLFPIKTNCKYVDSPLDIVSPILLNSKRYIVLDKLGNGAHAKVYHLQSNPSLALKVFTAPSPSKSDESQRRMTQWFINEVKILKLIGMFRSQGVLEGGNRYLVMNFVKGHHASYLIKQGVISSSQHLSKFKIALMRTLKGLHVRNIIHGDINDANVLFQIKRAGTEQKIEAGLVDFGLSKLVKYGDIKGYAMFDYAMIDLLFSQLETLTKKKRKTTFFETEQSNLL